MATETTTQIVREAPEIEAQKLALLESARNLVQDWNTGKIPFYTLPPKEAPKQNAVILEQYSKEFNLDELYPNQIKVIKELPEQDEDDFMSVSAPAPHEGRERGWSSDRMDEDDD